MHPTRMRMHFLFIFVLFREQGITAGIFIYVTFFEILNGEFSKGVNLMRLMTTLLGFVVMAALKTIPGHHDSDLSNHSDTMTLG